MNAELEIDYIFVCTPPLAADADRLADFGLQPGRSRVHAGQGTQNVCFFFDNAYLELLGRYDEAEARSPVVAPLGLWERIHWQQTGACPFGICLRLVSGSLEAVSAETWSYAAPFLPPDVTLPIFTPPNAVDLPLVFLSPAAVLPARSPASADLPLGHLGDRRTLTQIILQLPVTTARLKTLSLLDQLAQVRITTATSSDTPFHLELVWDGGTGRIVYTFRFTHSAPLCRCRFADKDSAANGCKPSGIYA